MSDWWKFEGRDHEQKSTAVAAPTQDSTPSLVVWSGALTDDGYALAEWMTAQGIAIPDVAAPAGSLLRPAALYFRADPEAAAALWALYRQAAGL